ncbi:WD40 domain-containing protein [Stratiformator vulcanicus]|uniref:Chromosome partition protein Smc n=1 Tax=Stratiformator vulcanicus TaxID=2527980 RepID=A0A517QVU7_9PLAN|nr:c-type cytochrome domain-containing protein [Stratiformator vulcanicus]QDT35776.1 Chromosome partition protein Smc [Stratiformator vulcanicus]
MLKSLGRPLVAIASLVILPGLLLAEDNASTKPKAPKYTFDKHVKPIFRAKCAGCHNASDKIAGLDLTTYAGLMQGGGAGDSIEPGDASASYLYMLVSHESEPTMPPESPKMADDKLAMIREWINIGAPENASSKTKGPAKNAAFDFVAPSSGRPAGPPPMPERLSKQPVVTSERPGTITALAANPWSPLVAIGGEQQVVLYDAAKLEFLGILPFPEGSPEQLTFSTDGQLLIAGGGRGAYLGKVVVWDVKSGQRVMEAGDETDTVLAGELSPDRRFIALGGPKREVKGFAVEDGSLAYTITKHTDWVTALAFSPDGVLLATADRAGGLHLWEAWTGREFLTLEGHKEAITALSWRSDSNMLASSSEDGKIRLWSPSDGKKLKDFGAHGGGVSDVDFTRDGKLVSVGRDKTAKLWDANGKQLKTFPAFSDIALAVTSSDETGHVIASDWSGEIRVFNTEDDKEVDKLIPNPPRLESRITVAQAAESKATKYRESEEAKLESLLKDQSEWKTQESNLTRKIAELDKQKASATEKLSAQKMKLAAAEKAASEAAQKEKSLREAEPALKAALESLAAALKALPQDQDLTQVSKELEQKLGATRKSMAETASLQTAQKSIATAAQSAIKAAEDVVSKAEAAIPAAKQQLDGLRPKLAEVAKAVERQQAAVKLAETAAKAAGDELARWQDELAFASQK